MKRVLQSSPAFVVTVTVLCYLLSAASLAQNPSSKRSKSDQSIDLIGQRQLLPKERYWCKPEQETEIAEQYVAAIEKSAQILQDPVVQSYVDSIAQRISPNSDAKFPITVHILDSPKVNAFTIGGGHQYVTRALLQGLQNEGELASILAHGIAHTSLRSPTRLESRAALLPMSSLQWTWITAPGSDVFAPSTAVALRKFQRSDELDADYFGIQYLYKSGYDTDSFLSAVQRVWPSDPDARIRAFSSFPPLQDRLTALRKEIARILPHRDGAVLSNPEFTALQDHLRTLPPIEEDSGPTLIRHDSPDNQK